MTPIKGGHSSGSLRDLDGAIAPLDSESDRAVNSNSRFSPKQSLCPQCRLHILFPPALRALLWNVDELIGIVQRPAESRAAMRADQGDGGAAARERDGARPNARRKPRSA